MTIQHIRNLIFALCLLTQICQAQDNKPKVTVEIRFVSILDLPSPELYLIGPGIEQKVTIHSRNLSPAHKVTIPVDSELHLLQNPPTDEQKNQRKLLREISLSSFNIQNNNRKKLKLIAVLLPDSSRQGKYKIHQLDDTDFPGGTRIAYNFSKSPVLITYGKSKTRIPSHEHKLIPAPDSKAGEFLQVKGFYILENRRRTFLSSRWVHDPQSRSIIFIYNLPNRDAPTFHGVEDTILPEPPKSP